ncbi:MAG: dienelactone hydrolase, partial [Planctomycetota bacterium]
MNRRPLSVLVVLLLSASRALCADYDPLAVPGPGKCDMLDLAVTDKGRERRLPLCVHLPVKDAAAPVVLFSHGLGGSRKGCAYLGKHWAARGYVAVFVQHPGSDTSVWKEVPPGERMAAIKRAASARNFLLRVRDIPAVLDQLGRWNAAEGHPLRGRLDLDRVGMSGH